MIVRVYQTGEKVLEHVAILSREPVHKRYSTQQLLVHLTARPRRRSIVYK